MTALSGYVLKKLWEDGEFILSRGIPEGEMAPLLVAASALAQPAPASLARLEHAYALRDELDHSWAVVPRALVWNHGRPALLMEDPGGDPLEVLPGQGMKLAQFLRIAIGITSALARLHARGLIHKDIRPANILVNAATGEVRLMGFGVASRLPQERQAPTAPEVIAGTLAYMAPEQTGRMNRSIDSRSDLYALGVTLFEMLSGTLPFVSSDPMELIHCHIARQPVFPGGKDVPAPVVGIILKLLAKTAEERYQTVAGVEADLRHCLASWESSGRIDPFIPGRHDTPGRLLIPEKLYGREPEIEILLNAFDEVVTRGTSGLVLVSGYSGIGKSSVVYELHRALASRHGLFAAGKFDQFKRDVPYATITQAFQTLIRQILIRSESEVSRWRNALLEALGQNGQVIANIIPELELIIGKQPPVQELPSAGATSRFYTAFRRFISTFARPEHPLVLFLDDLQWLDTATLNLLRRLALDTEVSHLLLIGAYRDNEVEHSHPLMTTLDAIRRSGAQVREIVLSPLLLDDVGRLLADALRSRPEQVRPLAQLVHEKSGGNPFFAIQFVMALVDEGLLMFQAERRVWGWDLESIRAKGYTDNVIDLMAGKLSRLPAATQRAVQRLASLGDSAGIGILSRVLEQPDEDHLHEILWEAVRMGLISRFGDIYAFLHDRIQEAAYGLIPEPERAAVHLGIGRVLVSRFAPDDLEERIFEIINQLNRGIPLIDSEEERAQLAEFNLTAGKRARYTTAYASASEYFTIGLSLVEEDSWENRYEIRRELEQYQAMSEFEQGLFDLAVPRLDAIIQRSRRKSHLLAAYTSKMHLYILKSEYPLAIANVRECLRLYGIEVDEDSSREAIERAYQDVWQKFAGRSIESILELPPTTDPEIGIAVRMLSLIFAPASFVNTTLAWVYPCHMVSLTLEHGTSPTSFFGIGYFGLMLGHEFGRYMECYRFCQVALALLDRDREIDGRAGALYMLAHAGLWVRPISEVLDTMRMAFQSSVEAGTAMVSCYTCCNIIAYLLVRGDHLDDVWQEADRCLAFVRRTGFRDVTDEMVGQMRFIQAMRGRTQSFPGFGGDDFDEAAFEADLTPERLSSMSYAYWVLKGQAQFIGGDFTEAALAFAHAAKVNWSSACHIQHHDEAYFASLTIAALYVHDGPDAAEQRRRLGRECDRLAHWAAGNPGTFADKHALVAAEIARINGQDVEAMHLYEKAIQLAQENGFVLHEAIASEVAARFYRNRGLQTGARTHLWNARYCYHRWGALGKVRHMDQHHSELRGEHPSPRQGAAAGAAIGATPGELDIATVIKASQALSGEIVLDTLIERLMVLAVEHAGAQRGLLILPRGDQQLIEAEATTQLDTVAVHLRRSAVTPLELPESVMQLVIRTEDTVILDDASAESLFSTDQYIQSRHARSILCLPLMKQATLTGVLYLENNLAPYVFTPDRVSVLQLLASQAAISLENARLYADIRELKDQLYNENIALREEVDKASMFEEIVGTSPVLRAVLSRVSKVAPTDSTVLITGETGTGKELIARAIHKRSGRSDRAFVSVNCAAIPQSLIGSELFGHEKGAFTGALQRRLGRFELAEGGTIFLDEIGELPLETQVALLRVLQEREFERVGGTRSIRADVRVIAATNRDLQAAIVAGTFRSDLYYRLNVFPMELPPLRERKEDIPVLVEYFIDRYASKAGKKIRGVNRKSLELLQAYPWPGNIRELQNVIERSLIVCETEYFSVDESWLSHESVQAKPVSHVLTAKLLNEEREMIEAALAASRGRVAGPSGAAAKLGIPPSTLDSKIKTLNINKHRFKSG